VQIFKGQSPQDAVARFLEQTGLSSDLAPKLQTGLVSRMRDHALLPLSEFTVTAPDGRDLRSVIASIRTSARSMRCESKKLHIWIGIWLGF